MQTQEEQDAANAVRIAAYRQKLNAVERARAQLAEAVNCYAKKLNLSMIQAHAAIRVAIKRMEYGYSPTQAEAEGKYIVRMIATTMSNQRLPCVRRRNGIGA